MLHLTETVKGMLGPPATQLGVPLLPLLLLLLWAAPAPGGASSSPGDATLYDPSMLLRFGNQAPVRKDYCDVVPVVLNLRPPAQYQTMCQASQVMSFGCRGQCRSYVEANPLNPMKQQRHCRCCEATRFGVHLASIPCDDGTKLRIALKFAMECLCRTCDEAVEDVPAVDPMEKYIRPMGPASNRTALHANVV